MIYEFIASRGKLTEEHNRELKSKRGFSDETITKYRFFSGGEYLLEIEGELRKTFSEPDLLKSGVFLHNENTKTSSLTPILLKDKIIIPYLKTEGEHTSVTLLRPHKLGLKDTQIQVYEASWGENLIIAESEFKAVAAAQLGFAAIGIPGISSFSDKYFPDLIKLLNDHKVRCCCIIFDSEVKDDPRFKNYKDKPALRFDTEYYAYLMAKMLDKEGKDVRIGTLPESWRVDGKIDLDGALAQGKTKEDIRQVIIQSKTYRLYLDDLSKEAQSVIRRKLDRKYYRSHIRVEFGVYVATRGYGKKEHDEEISNFTIRIMAVHDTPEGWVREVVLVNKQGDVSRSHSLPADEMSNDSFRTFCLNIGNYIWKGKQEDLSTLWEMSFLDTDETRSISEPDHVGWLEEEKMWLFGNTAVKDGKELRPDANGIFWLDKKGIRPIPLGITSGKGTLSEGVPYLSINDTCDINLVRGNLSDTIGGLEAAKCLGWVSAVPFMEETFHAFGCFPFLFLTGKTGSGKSTVAEWLCYFLGIERSGITLSQTTGVGIQRSLSYYSSLPVFLDEYRNTQDIVYKTSFLRNVYNRQSSGKGVKANFGLRMAKVRGTVIVAGEETPNDAALVNRSIIIEVIKAKKTSDHYEWFNREKGKFSSYLLKQLKSKDPERYLRVLQEAKDFFVQRRRIEERTSINYAVITAGYAMAFGEDAKFAQEITENLVETERESKAASVISTFITDLQAMKFSGELRGQFWVVEGEYIYIYFQGLYNLWAKNCKQRGVEILKASSLQGYFKEEPGFVESRVSCRINGYVCSCIKMDLSQVSEDIGALIDDTQNVST